MAVYLYVTLQADNLLLRFGLDPESGKLELLKSLPVPGGPAPLALSPGRQFLYVGRRGAFEVSSYRVDPHSGALALIGTVPLQGEPCYLATDRTGKFLLSAYYQAGGAAIHPINAQGAAYGPPVQWLETATGAHCFQTDPSNRFAFLPHIAGRGPNAIYQYRFHADTGQVTPNTPAVLYPERPDGPRHYCFHPHKNLVYFSNEQGCSVTAYRLDPDAGTLQPVQTVSTLPPGFDGPNTCSQIQITPDGRFLYAPNRGHNSVAIFGVDEASGQLTPLGHVAVDPVPRAFSLDPTGRFLYVSGLESGRLLAFRRDPDRGTLTPLEVYSLGARPMWVLAAALPG